MAIINKEAPLKVGHLLWAMGIFKVVIAGMTWFVLWYLSVDIKEAVSPLQTKEEFKAWIREDSEGWKEWLKEEFKPQSSQVSTNDKNIGILFERTDSRHRSTGSTGTHNMTPVRPPN